MIDDLRSAILGNKEKLALLGQFLLVGAIFFGIGILYENGKITKKNQVIEVMQKEHMQANLSGLETQPLSKTSGGSTSRSLSETEHKESFKKLPFFASKNGKAYYKTSCSSRIKEENKIYFKTEEDAQKSGFSPAKSCFK